jgi:hypothetical protein
MTKPIVFYTSTRPPIEFGSGPPTVILAEYPPLEGECSRDYLKRIEREMMAELNAPKPGWFERIRRTWR